MTTYTQEDIKGLVEELRGHIDILINHEAGLIPMATQIMLSQAADMLEASLWRDIESAPKDCETVSVFDECPRVAWLDPKRGYWRDEMDDELMPHCKPLSPPEKG